MILNQQQVIERTVPHLSSARPMLYDRMYWCPCKEWLDEYWRNFEHDLKWKPIGSSWMSRTFGGTLWQYSERNDCDNRACQALTTAQNLFVFTDMGNSREAQTVALFEIAGSFQGGHAMNMVLVDTGMSEPELRIF